MRDPSFSSSLSASGVMSITYTLYDVNGRRVGGSTETVKDGKSITFSIASIAPDFKGYITAYATDNVKNSDAVNRKFFNDKYYEPQDKVSYDSKRTILTFEKGFTTTEEIKLTDIISLK